jgi:spermidine synthase
MGRELRLPEVARHHGGVLIQVAVFAELVLNAAAAFSWRRSHLRQLQPAASGGSFAGWDDMTCFMDLARFGLTANSENVIFRAGHAANDGTPEVLVVQDQSKTTKAARRTLVFRSTDGKCNPQAGSVCAVAQDDGGSIGLSAFSKDEALLSAAGSSGMDKCSTLSCSADVAATLREPGAGYIRSMVGATAFLGDSREAPKHFLSIGLGAGTLALQLQQSWPGSQQTVVELSTAVSDAAKCFGAASGVGLDIVTGDGREYLESSADAAFDAVLVDAFDSSDKVPSCFTTKEFFTSARSKLKPGGLLIMNAHTGKTLHNDVKDLLPAASAVFGGGDHLQVGSAPGLANAIILARSADENKHSPSAFVQDDSDELKSWLQDASFAPASSETSSRILLDANVQCR